MIIIEYLMITTITTVVIQKNSKSNMLKTKKQVINNQMIRKYQTKTKERINNNEQKT